MNKDQMQQVLDALRTPNKYPEIRHAQIQQAIAIMQAAVDAPEVPSQAPALNDEEIEAIWQSLDGKSIITGENQLNWNRLVRTAFARAVIAAINAKELK